MLCLSAQQNAPHGEYYIIFFFALQYNLSVIGAFGGKKGECGIYDLMFGWTVVPMVMREWRGLGAASLIISLVFIIMCAAGCGSNRNSPVADPLVYRRAGFVCEAHGVLNKVEFTALIRVEAEDGAVRSMRVEYTSPATIAGLCAERTSGGVTVTCGELSVPGEGFSAILWPCEAFIPGDGVNILSLTKSKQEGDTVTEVALSDGYRILLDSASEFPKCIFFESNSLYIDWFEPLRG